MPIQGSCRSGWARSSGRSEAPTAAPTPRGRAPTRSRSSTASRRRSSPTPTTIDAAPGSDGGGSLGIDIGSLWIPLLAVVVIAAVFLALRLARNRERDARLAAEAEGEPPPEPVSELEQRARTAEGAGDYEGALRLRYGIALRTLQEQGAVPGGPSLTPARLHRELGHPRTGELVGTFERVVYGRREADVDDAREAREGWPVVVRDSTAAAAEAEPEHGEEKR